MGVAIGICSAVERVRWGAWEETVDDGPAHRMRTAVQAAGALALLLPPDDAAPRRPTSCSTASTA